MGSPLKARPIPQSKFAETLQTYPNQFLHGLDFSLGQLNLQQADFLRNHKLSMSYDLK